MKKHIFGISAAMALVLVALAPLGFCDDQAIKKNVPATPKTDASAITLTSSLPAAGTLDPSWRTR